MGDLRRSSLRRENVEEDREGQARRAQKPFRDSTRRKKIKSADARGAPWDSLFLPDARIHLRENQSAIPSCCVKYSRTLNIRFFKINKKINKKI